MIFIDMHLKVGRRFLLFFVQLFMKGDKSMKFGDNLKIIRKSKKISQEDQKNKENKR